MVICRYCIFQTKNKCLLRFSTGTEPRAVRGQVLLSFAFSDGTYCMSPPFLSGIENSNYLNQLETLTPISLPPNKPTHHLLKKTNHWTSNHKPQQEDCLNSYDRSIHAFSSISPGRSLSSFYVSHTFPAKLKTLPPSVNRASERLCTSITHHL